MTRSLPVIQPRPLTASGLERRLLCLGSGCLPQTRIANPYANPGSRLHRFVDRARAAGKEVAIIEALRDVPEEDQEKEREFLMALDIDAIPAGAESEVGFAFHVRTREAIRISGREAGYPEMGPDWILGTTDLVGMASPSTAFVADLKRFIFRSSADRCAQTDFYALCAVTVAGAEDAQTMLMRPIATGWITDRAYLDGIRLDAFADALEELVDNGRRAEAVYQAGGAQALLEAGMLSGGPQCELCDARLHCPVTGAMLAKFATLDVGALVEAVGPKCSEDDAKAIFKARALTSMESMTPEEVGQAFIAARLVLMAAEGAKAAADEIARRAPLPLPNGLWRFEGRTTRWVADEEGKARTAALKDELKASGNLTARKVPQMRTGKLPRELRERGEG